MPSAEYLAAYASIGTFVVIAITAIAAVVQLRHIRSANQLAGFMDLAALWDSDAFQRATRFVHDELPARLQNPQYRAELRRPEPDRREHQELVVTDMLERSGSYVKYGMIDDEQLLDIIFPFVISMWSSLKEVVALQRVGNQNGELFGNFEYLAARSVDYQGTHKHGSYPRGVRRMMTDADCSRLGVPARSGIDEDRSV